MQTNESEDKAVAENSYSNAYQNILNKGKLTVLAENSSTSYFIYKGKKMGYEYEILREFAKSIGVELEVKIVNNLDSLIHEDNFYKHVVVLFVWNHEKFQLENGYNCQKILFYIYTHN